MKLVTMDKFRKIQSSFIEGIRPLIWSKTGRVHPTIRAKTVTTRLASQRPNGQNLPSGPLVVNIPPTEPMAALPDAEIAAMWEVDVAEVMEVRATDPAWRPSVHVINIRSAFTAGDFNMVLVDADYAQLEVRLMAAESRDPELCRVINDNLDMHCYTAEKAYSAQFKGMSYQSLFETQASKDGFYAPRLKRMLQFAATREMEYLPDFLSEMDSPLVTSGRGTVSSLMDEVNRLADMACDVVESAGMWDVVDTDVFQNPEGWKALTGRFEDALVNKIAKILGIRDPLNKRCRAAAKAVIFGTMYGIGPTSLAAQITEATGVHCSKEDAAALIESIIHVAFPRVGETILRQQRVLQRNGFVRTALGRIRTPAGAWSADGGRVARARRQAGNFVIQGLASDVTRAVMIALEEDAYMREHSAVLVMQVHDELLMRCPKVHGEGVLANLIDIMQTRHGLDSPVPLLATGHVAYRWSDAK
jgi:DNA polymerase I-like protein with 3'-5' exonuclease and polymerase domains